MEELITRYTLEPDLQDYFVEGGSDLSIYGSYLSGLGREDVILYDIDNVEITIESLGDAGLTNGQRQRVIYLVRQLELGAPGGKYAGIVDRDLEDEFPTPLDCKNIYVTIFRDLESYFLTEDYINLLMVRISRASIDNWSSFFSSFLEALQWFHSIRLADRELELNAGRLRLRKYVEVVDGVVRVAKREYLTSLLTSNGLGGRLDEVQKVGGQWLASFGGDPRNNVRGHDFVELLLLCMKDLKAKTSLADEPALRAAFGISTYHHPNILEKIF